MGRQDRKRPRPGLSVLLLRSFRSVIKLCLSAWGMSMPGAGGSELRGCKCAAPSWRDPLFHDNVKLFFYIKSLRIYYGVERKNFMKF